MSSVSTERRIAYALAVGILLFTVAMLLWGYHETTFAIWGHEFELPWLVSVYRVSGQILLILSIIPVLALVSNSVEDWLEQLLERRPTTPFHAVCQFIIWLFTHWVFALGWAKRKEEGWGGEE